MPAGCASACRWLDGVGRLGGDEAGHTSPGLELGVYVLVAPDPDRQPHEDDEVTSAPGKHRDPGAAAGPRLP